MGKQPVACKEYCVEYWLKELGKSMDKHTGCRSMTIKSGIKHHNQSSNSNKMKLLPVIYEEKSIVFLSFTLSILVTNDLCLHS